jgi:hypothetical protein
MDRTENRKSSNVLCFLFFVYSKVEGQRLRCVHLNQTTLRDDQYKGMVDAMQQDEVNSTNFGRMVVLLASFASSPPT